MRQANQHILLSYQHFQIHLKLFYLTLNFRTTIYAILLANFEQLFSDHSNQLLITLENSAQDRNFLQNIVKLLLERSNL
ncbi:hypothetical protein D3C76_889120 [compost metagenome]